MREFQYNQQFKQDLAVMCDGYCESMTDQEFNWLVEGLHNKLKDYLKRKIELM